MTTRLDQPGTMPKLKPTPKSPSSKKAARKRRRARERRYADQKRAYRERWNPEQIQRERLGL